MSLTILEKIALGVSGLTAVGIGGMILATPHSFFASYGISLGNDASLLSELRAPAAGLAVFGILMLAGIWRAALVPVSAAVAMVVFVAFPAGRLLGLAFDGMPSGGIIGALVFELAVAALCVVAFSRRLGLVGTSLSSVRNIH